MATAGEAARAADAAITREAHSLEDVYRQGGFTALNQAVIERSPDTGSSTSMTPITRSSKISGMARMERGT